MHKQINFSSEIALEVVLSLIGFNNHKRVDCHTVKSIRIPLTDAFKRTWLYLHLFKFKLIISALLFSKKYTNLAI